MNEVEDENNTSAILYVPLSANDIKILIDIMNFVDLATDTLANQELKRPGGFSIAAKYNKISRNAKDFAMVLDKHMEVGEPTDGQIH